MMWAIERGEYSAHEYVGLVATEEEASAMCERLNTDLDGEPLSGYSAFGYTEIKMLGPDVEWAPVLTMTDWFDRDGAPINWGPDTRVTPPEEIDRTILGIDGPRRGRVEVDVLFQPAWQSPDPDREALPDRCRLQVRGADFEQVRKTFSDTRAQMIAQPERWFGLSDPDAYFETKIFEQGDPE